MGLHYLTNETTVDRIYAVRPLPLYQNNRMKLVGTCRSHQKVLVGPVAISILTRIFKLK
jgi:hypothetical protein